MPVYAKGKGADYLLSIAKPEPTLAQYSHVTEEAQRYVDNTNIFDTVAKSFGIQTDKK